jgi:RNA polymerase sigma-70 factor (ECF subfamily)
MDYKAETDEWLMQQVQAGRRDCLEVLLRRYATPLLTYLHRVSGTHHAAEDLLQETFLLVWTKRQTFAGRGLFGSWVFQIATNCFRQSRRSRLRHFSRHDSGTQIEGVTCPGPDPSWLAVATEQQQLLELAISRLPDQQRMVLVLRHWNRLPFAEIARVIDCSEATVRSHLHHALKRLRRSMESCS